jgi:hypothetical protein
MRAVLDSCVWIKLALPEADSDKAAALKDDFTTQLHELVAPDVSRSKSLTQSRGRRERES